MSERRALDHQLEEEQGDLQEQIEDLVGGGMVRKDVFESKAAVFLEIEAFILDFPA